MLTEVTGVEVGHWTDGAARTGCTVVVLPPGTVASGEIRGGAPATREFALLDPLRMVPSVDAVVLSGGSAFGLAAADGVVQWLEAEGRGFETTAGMVPIVVGMSLYDLAVGDGSVRPGSAEGRMAAEAATAQLVTIGAVGAGAGATIAKWRDAELARPAGLGGAVLRSDKLVVAGLFAVNAAGDIDDGRVAGTARSGGLTGGTASSFGNTTIGVVATNADLTKAGCHAVASSANDGVARALLPSHLDRDGDATVVASTGRVEADLDVVRTLATLVTEDAVRNSVG